MNSAWHWVSIGTADLHAALAFWVGRLGFEEIGVAEGDDPGLRAHWRLPDQKVARQAMVRAPGAAFGAIHLVEWGSATESVRADAAVFDLCPKNLDIYVDDLPRRMAQLAEQGVIFRNKHYSEAVSPDSRDTTILISYYCRFWAARSRSLRQVFMASARWFVLFRILRQKDVSASKCWGSRCPTTTFWRGQRSSK